MQISGVRFCGEGGHGEIIFTSLAGPFLGLFRNESAVKSATGIGLEESRDQVRKPSRARACESFVGIGHRET
jgi:hypothetical protein